MRVWYEKLSGGQKAAVIGAVAVIVVGFMSLCGALGGPVMGEVVKTWLARPTPTLTATSMPTATLTITPTFTPTATVTLTPTPDCRDIQVLYLELELATGLGQRKYPDANGVITLTHNDIDNFGALSGQAILSNTNAAGCSWKLEGRTGVYASWESIGNGNFSFFIDIPDQVTAIYLKLTIGGQIQFYTIEVQPAP